MMREVAIQFNSEGADPAVVRIKGTLPEVAGLGRRFKLTLDPSH